MICEHKRTHPKGCDDCPAVWCWVCVAYHEPPYGGETCAAALKTRAEKAERELAIAVETLKRIATVGCGHDESDYGEPECCGASIADIARVALGLARLTPLAPKEGKP